MSSHDDEVWFDVIDRFHDGFEGRDAAGGREGDVQAAIPDLAGFLFQNLAGFLVDVFAITLQYGLKMLWVFGVEQHGVKDVKLGFADECQGDGLAESLLGTLREIEDILNLVEIGE